MDAYRREFPNWPRRPEIEDRAPFGFVDSSSRSGGARGPTLHSPERGLTIAFEIPVYLVARDRGEGRRPEILLDSARWDEVLAFVATWRPQPEPTRDQPYLDVFPDFPPMVEFGPRKPWSFADATTADDVAPKLSSATLGLWIYVQHPERESRYWPDEPETPARYWVRAAPRGLEPPLAEGSLLETDDWDEVLAFAMAYREDPYYRASEAVSGLIAQIASSLPAHQRRDSTLDNMPEVQRARGMLRDLWQAKETRRLRGLAPREEHPLGRSPFAPGR
jgi:hypothetical protein